VLTFSVSIVTCGMTYKTGFRLDDWIYYIHTTWDYRQYSAIADIHTFQLSVTHALGFSVFTSRILATELQQSHCHFRSHMKSSFPSLVPFLPLFCNCKFQTLDSIQFLCSQARIPAVWRLETWLLSEILLYNHFAWTPRKTLSSTVPYCVRLVYKSQYYRSSH
jgi:hypothetical protein